MAVKTKIQVRRDTATNWSNTNPVLAEGEIGYVMSGTNATYFKIGDGTTTWNSLAFQNTNGPKGDTGSTGATGAGYNGVTSTSSVAIGTGSKTFTVASTGAYVLGDRVRVINTATNWVEGTITALTVNTSITVNVDQISGTGTLASWTVSIAGIPGTVGQTVTGPTGPGYSGVTSTSSVAISTGSKVFVVTSTGAYAIGTRVRAAHTSTPANYVEGLITGLVADTSITVNVDAIGGSGPQSSWTFSVAGNVGATGATGNGISSITRTAGNGAAGTTDTFTITYTSGSTTTFSVYNGSNGTNGAAGRGITSIARTSGTGLAGSTDTYTITYSDASTSTFTVVNGTNGTNGTAATIAVGTVTGLTAGATPTVVNGGSSSAATFNFGIPAGATGSAATIAVGTVTGLAAGATPTVVNGGNSSAATFNFGIPAGATGATGAGYDGITSSTSLSVNTGSKVITVNKIGALAVGTRIRVAYTTSPTTYAEGVITGIATLAVTFLVDQTNGTGTFTSWTVSVAGEAARYTLFASGTVANSATSGSSTLISSADFSGYKNIQLVISALGFSRTPTGRFLLRFNGTSTGYKNLYSNYSSTPSLTGDTSETGYLITNEPVTVTTSTNAQILVDIMNPSLNITTKQVSWQNKNGFGYGTNANIEGPITSMVIATSGNTPDFSWEIYGIK